MKKRTTWRQPCRAMRCRRPRYTFHLRMLITEVAAKVVSRTRSIIIIMTDMIPATPSTWFSSRPPTCSSFACDQTHTFQSQQATSVYNSEELVNLWPISSFSRVLPSPYPHTLIMTHSDKNVSFLRSTNHERGIRRIQDCKFFNMIFVTPEFLPF